jgi:hypothetical protein
MFRCPVSIAVPIMASFCAASIAETLNNGRVCSEDYFLRRPYLRPGLFGARCMRAFLEFRY